MGNISIEALRISPGGSPPVNLSPSFEKAGYSFEEQLRNLGFYFGVIIPEFRDGPNHDGFVKPWQSFMTDHHSPVELSWTWNHGMGLPVVGFSFDPIGSAAGLEPHWIQTISTLPRAL